MYEPKLIKADASRLRKRNLVYRAWVIISPLLLLCMIVIAIPTIPKKQDNKEPEQRKETITIEKLLQIKNITQAANPLSILSINDIPDKTTYKPLNQYKRPSAITAYLSNTNQITNIKPIITQDEKIIINMLPIELNGINEKENQILLYTNVYNTAYRSVMTYIVHTAQKSETDILLKITPTWNDTISKMPAKIRIDVYSPNDLGKSINKNFIVINER